MLEIVPAQLACQ